jgi:hypothetical protein
MAYIASGVTDKVRRRVEPSNGENDLTDDEENALPTYVTRIKKAREHQLEGQAWQNLLDELKGISSHACCKKITINPGSSAP